jgi:glutamine synthetase type III
MSPLYFSDAFVVASISWSRQQVMATALAALARKHGLVCYDPQAEVVIP